MATRSELLTRYARLPAFKGFVRDDIELYLDLALEAVEGYAPKRVKLKGIPSSADSRYNVPSSAKVLLGAFLPNSDIRIDFREEHPVNEDGELGDRIYVLLQVQVPSYIDLVREETMQGFSNLPTPLSQGYRYGAFAGATSGTGTHDLEFTTAVTVEDLKPRQLMALRYYAESEAYQFQATKSEHLSDVTDRDATGESTTLRRSQSGNAFQKLSQRRQMEFRREIARPYWSRDSFGLTEYLWGESWR